MINPIQKKMPIISKKLLFFQ